MLINLRNALMTGKRLPYDAEVEYLESTGTQWIDTLVNADSNLSVEITMANAGTPWSNVNPMGAILVTPRARHHLNFSATSSLSYYFCAGDTSPGTYIKPSDGEVFTYKVDAIAKTFSVNSSTFSLPNDTFDLGMTYWLFGRNGTTPPCLGSLRIYSAKLWKGNTLVRDYIPVRKGTVGYLYDRVSGKLFGNAGTGDFVVGPDVVPVEYLKSDGSQYIATDFIPNDSSGIYLKSAPMAMADVVHVGCRSTPNGRWWVNYGGASNINASWNSYASTDIAYASGRVYVVENNYLNSRSFVVNGETKNTALYSTTLATTTHPAAIFAANSSGSITLKAKCKIYELRFSQGSAIARDFRPVRVGTEGAMIDTLTRRIYRNAGTGAFTYGNDLKYPIPAE